MARRQATAPLGRWAGRERSTSPWLGPHWVCPECAQWTAFLKHLMVHDQEDAGYRGKQFSTGYHPCRPMGEMGALFQFGHPAPENMMQNVIAQGLGQPCCLNMTRTTPSKRVLGLDCPCPYSLCFSCSMRTNLLGTLQSGLANANP